MTKKWILAAVLTVVLCVVCFALFLTEAEAVSLRPGSPGEPCGENLTWVLDDNGTLTISGTGAMPNYNQESNTAPWFAERTKITSVVIEDGVTSIGRYAFYGCTKMESVTIAETVTAIREGAFMDCQRLDGVIIPDGVTHLSTTAGSLEWLDGAFENCISLTTINIPDGVSTIGRSAFYGCKSLKEITIGSGVSYVAQYAFDGCSNLTDVYISDLSAWCKIRYTTGAASLSSPLYSNDKDKRIYLNGTLLTELIIPDDITSIGHYAFFECRNITTVIIPNSVTEISEYAFSGCTALTSINIPDSVVSIGHGAFSSCQSLTSVTIPDSVTTLGIGTFSNCSSLSQATIGEGLVAISEGTFVHCKKLTSVTIPEGITKIQSKAFDGCNSLWHILYKGTEDDWGFISISVFQNGNKDLKAATIHYECTGNEVNESVDKHATCTEEGSITHTCSVCAESKTNTLAALGHRWKDATCVNPKTCTTCGVTEGEALGGEHSWDGGKVTKEPTCEETGLTVYTCTNCSATKEEAVAAIEHSYGQWYIEKKATCTGEGNERRDCKNCTYYETKAIAAIGHSYGSEVIKPTCTEQGYTTFTCVNCGDSYVDDYVDAKGHEEILTLPSGATCEQPGVTDSMMCSVCGEILRAPEVIPALGHSYGDWVEVTAPTTEKSGLEERTCANCGETEQRELAKLEPAPTDPTEPETQPTEPTEPAQTEPTTTAPAQTEPVQTVPTTTGEPQNNGGNSVVLVAVIAALGGIGIGGAAVLIVLKKKK